MVLAERRQVDERVKKIIELKNKVEYCYQCHLLDIDLALILAYRLYRF